MKHRASISRQILEVISKLMNFFLNNALISLNTDQTPKSILLTITRLITMRSQPIVLRLFCLVVVVVVAVIVVDVIVDVNFIFVVVLDVVIVAKATLKVVFDVLVVVVVDVVVVVVDVVFVVVNLNVDVVV